LSNDFLVQNELLVKLHTGRMNQNVFVISPSMSLTGLSLEMCIFHFKAISLSTLISRSKRPIFTYLGSLERTWDCGLRQIQK
jgi:hypothetical protein